MIENEERYGQEEGRQRLLVPIGWLLRWLWKRFKFLPAVLAIVSSAHAIESLCPGGASPRADILVCMDAETACASESSDLCFTDNGFSTRDDHRGTDIMAVTDATKAVLGSRYFKLEGILGGTGTGYATYNNADSSEIRLRWYQRFDQYQHYYSNHFLGISLAGSGACSTGLTLEIGGQSSVYAYWNGTCGVPKGEERLDPNQGAGATTVPVIKNGKWYLFETAVKVDTSCSDNLVWNGCNGVYKLWVDGVLVISHTNLNLGGTTHTAQVVSVDPLRNYRHKRNPVNPGKVYIDQIVIGNDADTEIGAATGATNTGTAVTDPYDLGCGIEPFYIDSGLSYSPELDGNPANYITICGLPQSTWRGVAGTASVTAAHTGVVADNAALGAPHAITEQSLRAQCTGANCGAGFLIPRMGGPATGNEGNADVNAYRNGALPQWVLHGYIYLPSASVPDDKIAYAGFAGDGTTAYSNYVALSENGGKWAIIQRHADGTAAYVVTSNTTITRDAWHQFEIIVWDSEGVSLMIDGVRLYTQQALTNSPTWLFDNAHDADHSGTVVGIIDYVGTGTVTAYYDDISQGSTSFWSSDGWGSDSPFTSAVTSLKNWLRFRLRHWRQRH